MSAQHLVTTGALANSCIIADDIVGLADSGISLLPQERQQVTTQRPNHSPCHPEGLSGLGED
jgi:hypothetical protein